MSVRNHIQPFTRVLGGIEFGPQGAPRATLGILLTSDGNDRWAVTARHVFQVAGVVDVLQPLISHPGRRIADTSSLVTSAAGLDFAAVQLDPAVLFVDEILGIGPVGQPMPPQVGRRVIKAGAGTGMTEGRIELVQGDIVRIELPPHYPAGCNLTDSADSGAVWVDVLDRRPVALHFMGNQGGAEWSDAVVFSRVCQVLALHVP